MKIVLFGILAIGLISCNSTSKKSSDQDTFADIKIAGAMKNVMWKGQLGSAIDLDTIANKKGLYGLGPEVFLTGELLINDGQIYVSRVTSDSTMIVEKTNTISAPFFVYGNMNEWNSTELPSRIKNIKDLEKLIDEKTKDFKRPFTFKLSGKVASAMIHIQNLPKGTKVSSPDEAHQGQTSYSLNNEDVEIVGFFSTAHKGIFTHHDAFSHMHLITKDESKMGHLDNIEFEKMKLYLPKK